MCGLYGIIEPTKISNKHIAELAGIANITRGGDGCGIMTVAHSPGVQNPGTKISVKKTGDMYMPLPSLDSNVWALCGHTRAATTSCKGYRGAHPFKAGPIVLMHNGTVTTSGRKAIQELIDKKMSVDSAEIAEALATHAVEDVLNILDRTSSAYALVWFDKRDDTIRIVRNAQRPLHFVRVGEGLAYSSDKRDLAWAAIKAFVLSDIKSLIPNVILSFKRGEEIVHTPRVPAQPEFTGGSSGTVYQGANPYGYQPSGYPPYDDARWQTHTPSDEDTDCLVCGSQHATDTPEGKLCRQCAITLEV